MDPVDMLLSFHQECLRAVSQNGNSLLIICNDRGLHNEPSLLLLITASIYMTKGLPFDTSFQPPKKSVIYKWLLVAWHEAS